MAQFHTLVWVGLLEERGEEEDPKRLGSFGFQPWDEAAEFAKDRMMWREQDMDMLAQNSTRNPAT